LQHCLQALSSDKTELYFFGVIDLLTVYDFEKKLAHNAKTIKYAADEISTVDALSYATRFLTFMDKHVFV